MIGGDLPLHAERPGAAAIGDAEGLRGGLAHGSSGVVRLRGDARRRIDRQGGRVAGGSDVIGVGDDHLVFGRAGLAKSLTVKVAVVAPLTPLPSLRLLNETPLSVETCHW